MDQFSRTRLLFGGEAMEKLRASRVAVFGIGGVGGYVVEALVRSGVGQLDLVDHDRVSISNLNRQIIAAHSTIGMYKVDAARSRALDIAPDCVVRTHRIFYGPETAGELEFGDLDYVVDAIDNVTGKLMLAEKAALTGTPIISCMGTGNKTDPTALEVADIFDTSMDPLARIIRKELKKRGVKSLKVVYSKEEPIIPASGTKDVEVTASRRPVPGSTAFVPAAAGLIIAGQVVMDLVSRDFCRRGRNN